MRGETKSLKSKCSLVPHLGRLSGGLGFLSGKTSLSPTPLTLAC